MDRRIDLAAGTVTDLPFRTYKPIAVAEVTAYQVQAADLADGEDVAYFADAKQVHQAPLADYVLRDEAGLYVVVSRLAFESRYVPE
jgi:hypothetical protein